MTTLCPACNRPLERVELGANCPLNQSQFDSCKAGDYYCRACPSNDRGQRPLCYWWKSELTMPPLGVHLIDGAGI